MRSTIDFSAQPPLTNSADEQVLDPARVDRLVTELETNGIVLLPDLIPAERLSGMQHAFATKLRRLEQL